MLTPIELNEELTAVDHGPTAVESAETEASIALGREVFGTLAFPTPSERE